jgi:hypothetical protein
VLDLLGRLVDHSLVVRRGGQADAEPRFAMLETIRAVPLVPLGIFQSRTTVVINVLIRLTGAAFFGWFFFSPLYAQRILGYDALQTGLSLLPATLTMATLSIGLMPKIVATFGPKRPPPMFLLGLGAGLTFTPPGAHSDQTSPTRTGGARVRPAEHLPDYWRGDWPGRAGKPCAAMDGWPGWWRRALSRGPNEGYHLAFWVAAVVSISRTLIAGREIQPAPVEAGGPSGAANFVPA